MADLPEVEGGWLFLVVDNEFYALSKAQMKSVATKIVRETSVDAFELLTTLSDSGFVLADIQGPGESSARPDSCACCALNIDRFEKRIAEKREKIQLVRAAEKRAADTIERKLAEKK